MSATRSALRMEAPTARPDHVSAALLIELRWISGLHGTGTSPTGASPRTAAVDGRGRVHRVRGLLVADASIMPTPVPGNTSGPTMTVAS